MALGHQFWKHLVCPPGVWQLTEWWSCSLSLILPKRHWLHQLLQLHAVSGTSTFHYKQTVGIGRVWIWMASWCLILFFFLNRNLQIRSIFLHLWLYQMFDVPSMLGILRSMTAQRLRSICFRMSWSPSSPGWASSWTTIEWGNNFIFQFGSFIGLNWPLDISIKSINKVNKKKFYMLFLLNIIFHSIIVWYRRIWSLMLFSGPK